MAKPKIDYKVEVASHNDRIIGVYILDTTKAIEKMATIEGINRIDIVRQDWIIVSVSPLYDSHEVAQEIERAISIPGVFLEGDDD